MNLAWAVKYAVQARGAHVLKCLLSLNGLRAAGSYIDCRVLGVVPCLRMLIFVVPGLRTLFLAADVPRVLAMLLFSM